MVEEQLVTEFNMGVASMQRMDSLIRNIAHLKTVEYQSGNPVLSIVLRMQKALYVELYPYLDDKEVKEANTKYLNIFRMYPIINTGNSLVVPIITEDAMDDFQLWTMKMLLDKGILTRLGEDPWEAMI